MIERMVFYPDPSPPMRPTGVEDRWLTTADGLRLHAWWAGDPDGPVLVWSHGNAGHIGDRLDLLLAFAARGLGVLAYDYRGYGGSEGHPSERGVYLDAEAAYDSLRTRGIDEDRIVCFGESLGGAVSIALATRRSCAAVAVVSTFTSLSGVGRFHFGPLAALARNRFDSIGRLSELDVPLFVAHGDQDEIVPFELGRELFEAARPPKTFHRAPGRSHNDVFTDPALLDALVAFARNTAGADP